MLEGRAYVAQYGIVMKIEILENNKIKVSLTVEDLMYHNLKPERLSPDSPGLHKFIFSVMENVRRETGFNPYMGAVAIEAVQSKDGIVLYISSAKVQNNYEKNVTLKGDVKKVRVYKRKTVNSGNRYVFNDFPDLCSALVHLDSEQLSSDTVYEYGNRWYYILSSGRCFETAHSVLSEYCTEFGSSVSTEAFLQEHGKLIAKGESLVSLADGLHNL